MAQSLTPRSRSARSGPPRQRKLKAAPATIVARGPHDRLSDSPAPPAIAPPRAKAIRQTSQPIEVPPAGLNPVTEARPGTLSTYPVNIDVEALTKNLARLVEQGGRAIAAYLKPREDGTKKTAYSDEVADAVKTLGHVAEYWYADPQRTVEMQTRLGKGFLDLFASASRRLATCPNRK